VRNKHKSAKTPVVAVAIRNPRREPRVAVDATNSDASYPIWRVSLMDLDGPWPWSLPAAKLQDIQQKLSTFEGMTWAEIVGPRHHTLSTQSVCKKARDRLVELNQDDAADLLFSFAFSGKERLVGIRTGREFRILWWDQLHEVCPSTKKHT